MGTIACAGALTGETVSLETGDPVPKLRPPLGNPDVEERLPNPAPFPVPKPTQNWKSCENGQILRQKISLCPENHIFQAVVPKITCFPTIAKSRTPSAWTGCVPLFERARFRGDRDVVGRASAVRASAGSLFACGRVGLRHSDLVLSHIIFSSEVWRKKTIWKICYFVRSCSE